jgi:hypothetical protein
MAVRARNGNRVTVTQQLSWRAPGSGSLLKEPAGNTTEARGGRPWLGEETGTTGRQYEEKDGKGLASPAKLCLRLKESLVTPESGAFWACGLSLCLSSDGSQLWRLEGTGSHHNSHSCEFVDKAGLGDQRRIWLPLVSSSWRGRAQRVTLTGREVACLGIRKIFFWSLPYTTVMTLGDWFASLEPQLPLL